MDYCYYYSYYCKEVEKYCGTIKGKDYRSTFSNDDQKQNDDYSKSPHSFSLCLAQDDS